MGSIYENLLSLSSSDMVSSSRRNLGTSCEQSRISPSIELQHAQRRRRYHNTLKRYTMTIVLLLICFILLCTANYSVAALPSIKTTSLEGERNFDSVLHSESNVSDNNDIVLEEDDEEEDDILSDYDHTLDLGSSSSNVDEVIQQQQSSPKKIKIQQQQQEDVHSSSSSQQSQSTSTTQEEKDPVIILSAVDGTLAGISRTTGQLLWKQSRNDDIQKQQVVEWTKFLSPLVSSSMTKDHRTTAEKQQQQSNNYHQWHYAVPSVDGTVYLTGNDDNTDNDDNEEQLSVTTHIRDLVNRAPFVDAQQRFFVGSRRAMVAAIDESSGEILRVIPKWKTDENEEEEEVLPPSLEGRDVVWIGRLEHTVTVHDLHKGTVDIEFSVAEILSVDEMIHGDSNNNRVSSQQHDSSSLLDSSLVFRNDNVNNNDNDDDGIRSKEEQDMEQLFTDYITEALRHPNDGDRILRLPAPNDELDSDKGQEEDVYSTNNNAGRDQGQMRSSSSTAFLVSTPSGNVAFRDDSDNTSTTTAAVGWVSFALLESPVIYAIEASSGRKIRVNMLDDSSISKATAGRRKDGLPQLLEQQIASLEQQSSLLNSGSIVDDEACRLNDKSGECRAVGFSTQGSVVSSLQNGQIYALPLGERIARQPQHHLPLLGLPSPHQSAASEMANVVSDNHDQIPRLNTQHAAIGFHENRHDNDESDDVDSGDTSRQQIHLDASTRQSSCTPASPLYPGCLIGASLMMGNLLDIDGNFDMNKLQNLIEENTNRKKKSYFQKILTSWIAPTVALIFVLSFELGRRERLKIAGEQQLPDGLKDVQKSGGVIQLSDEILGYGGHGTIVYKGVLDKRQVAVKRLLAMYHASADREISLLIESDGHPNVVRYFLKEMRGDFVYLALELCNMSLNDLIVSLSKLRNNIRKENLQFSSGVEIATKSLLYQIASGVKHIHSLRIVHRDLKPQNILLALRNMSKSAVPTTPEESGGGASSDDSESEIDDTTHSTCSDTNTILENFKNQDYVPKISDMGLGKQLAGQSSFGLSTLGTGSVGGGVVGEAGAGAGSVGWQAPEVMAQRWSPETSSSNNEESEAVLLDSSPLEANRTSRSVDIFSLGCVFYCTILPGSHPFGEWYERESNIMKNTPNREDLEFVSPDASDLILAMISRDPKARPTADEVCEHPFFWSLSKRLKFLCDLSDRIELCDTSSSQLNADNSSPTLSIYAIEKDASNIFGTSWEKHLDPELIHQSVSRRTYDPSSVRDLLRMIRNKHHHYDELSATLKSRIGSSTDGLSKYIRTCFPRLIMHCYHFCISNLAPDDSLACDYELPIQSRIKSKVDNDMAVITDLSALDEMQPSLETIPGEDVEMEQTDQLDISTFSVPPELQQEVASTKEKRIDAPQSQEIPHPPPPDIELETSLQTNIDDLSGIVIWGGSNTARETKCRGWYRSDDDWRQRLDTKLRKRDSNLAKCAEDPKFRTRLCNHWDVSQGTRCPMRKKNKCIFAHGPVELRVKEGKRQRWGKLVNKHGLCANPKASGGEDTYGAARMIENTRKDQGQWTSADSKQKKQAGKGGNQRRGKQSPNKKKKKQEEGQQAVEVT